MNGNLVTIFQVKAQRKTITGQSASRREKEKKWVTSLSDEANSTNKSEIFVEIRGFAKRM